MLYLGIVRLTVLICCHGETN